jgi:hypothetical protein
LSRHLTRHAALYRRALARLKRGRGAESHNSVHFLVWDLAVLWTRETGLLVTSSAVNDYSYAGSPQSAAGRFIVTAFDTLFQASSEMEDPATHPDSWVAKVGSASDQTAGRVLFHAQVRPDPTRAAGQRLGPHLPPLSGGYFVNWDRMVPR